MFQIKGYLAKGESIFFVDVLVDPDFSFIKRRRASLLRIFFFEEAAIMYSGSIRADWLPITAMSIKVIVRHISPIWYQYQNILIMFTWRTVIYTNFFNGFIIFISSKPSGKFVKTELRYYRITLLKSWNCSL